jgi:crotonobetainyl-CoA:carnitine CoA-transferase CaiB-like acyl-CoA transferase
MSSTPVPFINNLTDNVTDNGFTAAYAASLLASLGLRGDVPADGHAPHPALVWARSGLMALTGDAEGTPQLCPAPLAGCANAVLHAWRAAFGSGPLDGVDGAPLLAERAATMGLKRQGAIAPGGSCRLLDAADGRIALNLARDEDRLVVPAWLECETDGRWDSIAAILPQRSCTELLARGRLLGLAVAEMARPSVAPPHWYRLVHRGKPERRETTLRPPLVVDLSSLWAGPLCTHLLQRAGAKVVKVESLSRPDGARRGHAGFFDLLNHGKASVALDFSDARDRRRLRELLRHADIVIEASRPRALRQMGIVAEELLDERPGLSWIAISGYGRDTDTENLVAFGDDAGVAGGLSALMHEVTGRPLFCGDAIADPLTGLHAALLAWTSWHGGGGRLLSIALRDVVAHCAADALSLNGAALQRRHADWRAVLDTQGVEAAMPRARAVSGVARGLGADTEAVLALFGIRR